MALRFMDSFDHYATADILKKWTAKDGTATIKAGGYHGSTSYLALADGSSDLIKTIDSNSTWDIGFAFKAGGFTTGTIAPLVQLIDSASSTVQVSLRLRNDGAMEIVRGTNSSVTGGVTAYALKAYKWYWIEFHCTIADSIVADSCAVWVSDQPWATVATGQDLKAHATTATADQIKFFGFTTPGSVETAFDDIIICDGQTGSGHVSWPLGQTYVDILYPTSDGTTNDWTPSTGSRYACVDEPAQNSDTDYVSSNTAGNVQLFNVSDVGHSLSWSYGIQVNLFVRSDTANVYTQYPLIRSNSTTYAMTTQSFVDTSAYLDKVGILEVDPTNSDVIWSGTALDALEAGVQLNSVT